MQQRLLRRLRLAGQEEGVGGRLLPLRGGLGCCEAHGAGGCSHRVRKQADQVMVSVGAQQYCDAWREVQ
eukprot:scaffold136842_cov18-Tisochrysis_lutea.AAC.1